MEEQDEELVSDVFNLGVSGDDSSDLLARIEEEFESRRWDESSQIVLIQVGANDIQYLKEKEGIRVSKQDYRDNLNRIIDTLETLSDYVIVVSDFYISIEGEIPYSPDKKVSDGRLEEYMKVQKEICQTKDVYRVDLRDKFKLEEAKEMLEDGLHPDSEGHRKIFEIVKKRLQKEEILP